MFLLNVGRAAFKQDWGLVTGMLAGALDKIRGQRMVEAGGRA